MNIIEIFTSVRDIPYQIPLSLQEEDKCCAGKHKKLKKLLSNYESRYRVCDFKWSDLGLPTHVESVPHSDDCTHMYLEILLDNRWVVLDATWDKPLQSILLVNFWDGKSDTKIAVPARKIYSPEKSLGFIDQGDENDFDREISANGSFYRAFNNWLQDIRQKND